MITSVEFLVRTVSLTWADVLWGYRKQLIGWRVPIGIANAREVKGYDPLEAQLATLGKDQDWQVGELVEALATREPVPEEVSKRKWLFLTLCWLYENQNRIEDVFRNIEDIYADFDYPEEMSSFVPFLPPEDGYDPAAHTSSENRARILRKWKEYLDRTKSIL